MFSVLASAEVEFAVRSVVCLYVSVCFVMCIDRTALLLKTLLLGMLHKFVNFHYVVVHYFVNNLDPPQYREFQSTPLRNHAHWHQYVK